MVCDGLCTVLIRPDNTCLQVDRLHYPLLKYDDEDLSKWFGLGLAEIAVDRFLPPVAYYLRPMNIGWAVDILRRAADICWHEISSPGSFGNHRPCT